MILLFCSCNQKAEKQKTEQNSEPNIESNAELKAELKAESELDTDYSTSAELFAKDVLKENLRKHTFEIADLEKPVHAQIFYNVGLQKIEAYSNKNYPKNSKPNYYEHFTLFVATYNSEINALKTFELIKECTKKQLNEIERAEKEFLLRIDALNIGVKPGGMIVQSGKQIFSLVETCRETPIGGTWKDYEDKFIGYIVKNREEIEVLNSDCGKMTNYIIEKRKASR